MFDRSYEEHMSLAVHYPFLRLAYFSPSTDSNRTLGLSFRIGWFEIPQLEGQ